MEINQSVNQRVGQLGVKILLSTFRGIFAILWCANWFHLEVNFKTPVMEITVKVCIFIFYMTKTVHLYFATVASNFNN